MENKPGDDVNSSELDEDYLIELEKDMPDEEKQVNVLFIVRDLPRELLFKVNACG